MRRQRVTLFLEHVTRIQVRSYFLLEATGDIRGPRVWVTSQRWGMGSNFVVKLFCMQFQGSFPSLPCLLEVPYTAPSHWPLLPCLVFIPGEHQHLPDSNP